MKKSVLILTLTAGILMISSCASKKDLQNCQNENRELTTNYQTAKEQLAASQAKVSALEDQLAQQKRNYASLQSSLDKCSTQTRTILIYQSLSIKSTSRTNTFVTSLR